MPEKIIIGFEGSANKLGVAILTSNFKILANLRQTFVPAPGQGFSPAEVCEHHSNHLKSLTEEALRTAGVAPTEIDVIAYTRGQGIASGLNVVAVFVQSFALALGAPIVPVNHCIAHIEMGLAVTRATNPLILYVSGGNSQLLYYSAGRYHILGETVDSALGNTVDKVGRSLGVSNDPCVGVNVERVAEEHKTKDKVLKLPIVAKGFDFGFAGVGEFIERANASGVYSNTDICYSLQENLFGLLAVQCDKAVSYLNAVCRLQQRPPIDGILATGGVGCNVRMQKMLGTLSEKWNLVVFSMDDRFCVDNGAMIAWTGWLQFRAGQYIRPADVDTTQRFRTDEVVVSWK